MDRLMHRGITQKTSVKIYNDQFNEALVLANQTGATLAFHRAYENGLKEPVINALVPIKILNPRLTFRELQQHALTIDKGLQQNKRSNPVPARTVINNPVFNIPAPAWQTTPAWGTTPIKVETAHQYTRLTPEECAALAQSGGCFYCRQCGHMASQCPNHPPHQVAAVTVPEVTTAEPAPAPAPAPNVAPASDF